MEHVEDLFDLFFRDPLEALADRRVKLVELFGPRGTLDFGRDSDRLHLQLPFTEADREQVSLFQPQGLPELLGYRDLAVPELFDQLLHDILLLPDLIT